MVTVTMLRRNGRTVGFIADGHAGYADAGNDIVCSAISALTQTCYLGLIRVAGLAEGKELSVTIDDNQGMTCVLAGDTGGEQQEKAELLFLTMETGLTSITEAYRKSLKIRHREV